MQTNCFAPQSSSSLAGVRCPCACSSPFLFLGVAASRPGRSINESTGCNPGAAHTGQLPIKICLSSLSMVLQTPTWMDSLHFRINQDEHADLDWLFVASAPCQNMKYYYCTSIPSIVHTRLDLYCIVSKEDAGSNSMKPAKSFLVPSTRHLWHEAHVPQRLRSHLNGNEKQIAV